MVRKVSAVICSLVLICALCTTAQASTHTIYENSTISSTYLTYFRDILYGLQYNTEYVVFRSGQNEYKMITMPDGYLNVELTDNYMVDGTAIFSVPIGLAHEYTFSTEGNSYNTSPRFEYKKISEFELIQTDEIIYSSCRGFPQLIDERSEAFEFVQTLFIIVAFIALYVFRIFNSSKRRKY